VGSLSSKGEKGGGESKGFFGKEKGFFSRNLNQGEKKGKKKKKKMKEFFQKEKKE